MLLQSRALLALDLTYCAPLWHVIGPTTHEPFGMKPAIASEAWGCPEIWFWVSGLGMHPPAGCTLLKYPRLRVRMLMHWLQLYWKRAYRAAVQVLGVVCACARSLRIGVPDFL